MNVRIVQDRRAMGAAAATHAAGVIRRAIDHHGKARIVVATGASQLDFLAALTSATGIAQPGDLATVI